MSARDERVSTHVTATVETIDEALAWVVQQMERRGFDRPRVEISPTFRYGDGPVIGGAPEGEWMFDVSIACELPR